MGELGPPVDLPGHVDLVVATVGADPPRPLGCSSAVTDRRAEPPYRVRRSDRARRVRVSVDGDGQVEVVLPRRAPEHHASEAVRELRPWIERRRRAVARAAAEMGRAPGTVPYLGETLRLVPEAGRTRVHRRGDALLVPAGDPREALERWYRRRAR